MSGDHPSTSKVAKTREISKDLIGRRFSHLVVVRYSHEANRRHLWLCRCDCGGDKLTDIRALVGGKIVSCGCRKTTHGMTDTHEFRCWSGIKQRCTNKNDKGYVRYGGRGIAMFPGWLDSFEAFLEHIGPSPSPNHSVDRYPDMNGNYEPGNVRWATSREQTRNTNYNRFITIDGRTQIAADWCDEIGIHKQTFHERLAHGWDEKMALLTPVRPYGRKNPKRNGSGVTHGQ